MDLYDFSKRNSRAELRVKRRKARNERHEEYPGWFGLFFYALLAPSHDLDLKKQKGVEQFVLLIHMYKRP